MKKSFYFLAIIVLIALRIYATIEPPKVIDYCPKTTSNNTHFNEDCQKTSGKDPKTGNELEIWSCHPVPENWQYGCLSWSQN